MALIQLKEVPPRCADDAWVADSAQVIGDATLGAQSSVWYGAVIRADQAPIDLGAGSNVQDGAVLHADPGFPLTVGERVTIGHQAMLHGCTVGDGSLIGIGAIVLNGARIGRNCLVAAGALVTEGKEFPDGVLIVGSPAVVKRALSDEQIQALHASAAHYISNARLHAAHATRLTMPAR